MKPEAKIRNKKVVRILGEMMKAGLTPTGPGVVRLTVDDHGRNWLSVFIVRGQAHIGRVAEAVAGVETDLKKVAMCRVCGCTEDHACPSGCSWFEKDLCSHPGCIKAAKP